jgi:CubicO group peptidase (beta-lactamase class C family)
MKLIDSFKSKAFRTISVPDDLSTVTTCDAAEETEPEQVQMTREGVDAIWSRVEDLYRTGIYPGIALCLRKKGQVVLRRAIGHSHGNGPYNAPGAMETPDTEKVLMTPDTPVCQYSASKAVTAMMIHWLAEKGQVNLSDPVMRYIPEFAAHGKHKITIFNIISHHGGIPAPPPETDPEILFDHEGLVKMVCNLTPRSKDGSSMAYHAVTGGTILGEIVQRVTGRNIRELLKETVQEPLGFRYFNYGVPEADFRHVATDYATGVPLFFPLSALVKRALSVGWDDVVRIANQPRFYKIIIPAANLVATADEMSQFYQMLLNGGELNGRRIFAAETVRRAVRPAAKMWFDGTLVIPMRYSPGLMLGGSPVGIWGPYSESAYGHVGFINIFCWADPARDISVSLQTTGKSLIGSHIGPLARFLFTVGRHCRITDDPVRDIGTFASFKAVFQKMLRRVVLGG